MSAEYVLQEYHEIFKYPKLNEMQMIVFNQLFENDCNMVIAAPTGSGKTVCHELAIVRLLHQYQDKHRDKKDLKVVRLSFKTSV